VEFQTGRPVDHRAGQRILSGNRNPDSTKNRSSRSCPRARWTACSRSLRNFQLVQRPCDDPIWLCSRGRPDARLTFICQSSKTQGFNWVQGACKNTFADLTATIKVLDVLEVFDLTTSEPVLFLFGKHKGVRGGCWCTFHRCTSGQFDRMARDERKKF